ncbi:hypothetical protein AMAG_03121 [Allomyces macrogynus ATCC 38327]|uniref:Uncharacterized protein n=1 Tax=Allomyces macrogynus (strain ATCC 38327) TaxID=578462 RepID=A0A0L0S4L6_ALLM3|nr:hypothetical protein AMAG_03121 [Allomyces macrogynus ATCC 38327]|eukprot:KNE57400.1 hypothetical protein AMAG_03121 [Allomyces macrogynus ATCC 38327]
MTNSQAIELRAVAPTTAGLTKRLALFFAAGAVLGTTFDGLHANHDILAVSPEFGASGLPLGLAPYYMPRRVFASLSSPRGPIHPSARTAWTQLGMALVGYGLSSLVLFHLQWPTNIVSVLLGAMFLATWALTNGWIITLVACLVVWVGGSVWEMTLCTLGQFWYFSPDALGAGYVTHWIVWLWAGAALGGVDLASVYIAQPVVKQA